jgi:hypothetical protein
VDHRSGADLNEVIGLICREVAEKHEVQVEAVALVKAGSVPKTSSGKVRRGVLLRAGRSTPRERWGRGHFGSRRRMR